MVKCKELENELEDFWRNTGNEIDVRSLEKWMQSRLGVERLPNTGGSMIRYEHKALEEIKGDRVFGVHRKKGSKKEVIYRKNFLNYLRPFLKMIIAHMKKEGLCGD